MYFITLLFKNLTRRKALSALTVLVLACAIGAMVTALGIAQGFEDAFYQAFRSRSADVVVTAAGQADQLRSDLPEEIAERIRAEVPGVKEVRPGMVEVVDVAKGDSVSSAMIHGWPTDSPLFNDLVLLDGRRLQPGDEHAVMLGTALAASLDKKVGDEVRMQEKTFYVVGIFRSHIVFENGGLVIALPVLQELMGREGRVTGFTVLLDDKGADDSERRAEEACRRIEALRDGRGKSYRIAAQPSQQYVKGSLHIKLAHGMAWVTSIMWGLMAWLISAITMLISVLARVKEIGVLRAMGWRKSRVVRMILGESLILCVLGAVLGIVAAVGVVRWLSTLPLTSGFVQGETAPEVMAYGLLTALLVAFAGAVWPAWLASRWQPTEAFRHD